MKNTMEWVQKCIIIAQSYAKLKCEQKKIMDNFQIAITFYSRLKIEHGSRSWKGVG
jgi:hypothetical protein